MLPYERQLEVKQEQVDDALTRIGRLEGYALAPIVPALEQWRYRNKLEYSFGEGPDGELVCGFHAPGRFDQILPLTDCVLASERSNAAREQVVAELRRQGLGAWDRRTQQGFLRNLVVREGRRTGQLQVRLVTSPGKLDADALIEAVDAEGLLWTQTAGLGESTQGGETALLSGAPQLHEQLGDLRFLISPEAFFQTNTEMAEVLYGHAAEAAALRGHERVFDLYCGIGTIGLSLAARAREVVGVELVETAVSDAIENAKLNEITNASFFAGDIRAGDARAGREGGQARRRRDRPAARRPVAEGRAPHHRGRAAADRLRLLQPDDARAQRRPARRGGLDPRSPCSPSTCSPRRRTSSAWRCWRRREPHPHLALRLRQRLPRRGRGRADARRHRDPRQREGDPRRGRASSAARSCRIALTHAHGDHIGSLDALAADAPGHRDR